MKNFNLGKTLGEGSFAKVKLAIHNETQQKVAIKILNKSKMTSQTMNLKVQQEITILKTITHPHIIQLYQIFQDEQNIFLVMEYAKNGDLIDFIKDNNALTEIQASIILLDIIEAVTCLHQHRIAHRDIKLANILLTQNQTAKLIDFGLSKKYEVNEKLKTGCGSPCFAAPELIKEEPYDPEKADVWSIGVVLYCLVEGKLPFYHHNIKELYRLIGECQYSVPKTKNQKLKKLFKQIFVRDPMKRISLKKVLDHPSLMVGKILRRKQREKKEQNTNEKIEIIKAILSRKMSLTAFQVQLLFTKKKQFNSLNTTISLMKTMTVPDLQKLLEKQTKILLRTTSMRSSISSTTSNFKSEGADCKKFFRKANKNNKYLKSTKSTKSSQYNENIKYINTKTLMKYSESLERGKLEEILNRNNENPKVPDTMMTKSVNVSKMQSKHNLAFYKEGLELPLHKHSCSMSKIVRRKYEDVVYLLEKWGRAKRTENCIKVHWKNREYRIIVDRVSLNLQMIRCEPFSHELVSQALKFMKESF